MRSSRFLFVPLALFLVLALACSALAGHGGDKPDRTGILMVAFGTTVPEAEAAFAAMDRQAKAAFPGLEVRWAYTSSIIRRKLAAQGRHIASPAAALAAMGDDGFTGVAVQSLHTIPGEEYHSLADTVARFRNMPKGIRRVELGAPLLATSQDLMRCADALLAALPAERRPGEAVVFLGHGTHHPADVYYAALQYHLWGRDPNVLVGTVEGTPSMDDVLAELAARQATAAYLVPLMSVAGDHARNDMAGDDPDSWSSALAKAGVKPIPVLKGTAQDAGVAAIWIDHLRDAMQRLEEAH